MGKTSVRLLPYVLVFVLAAPAGAWMRSRMFDAQTPFGPQYPHAGRPAWPINSDWDYEEYRASELNGPPSDKRLTIRVRITDQQNKLENEVRILGQSADPQGDNYMDPAKPIKATWSLCVMANDPNIGNPYSTGLRSDKSPELRIVLNGVLVKFQFNLEPTLHNGKIGWYMGSGAISYGGEDFGDGVRGYSMSLGSWHTVELILNPVTRAFSFTVNGDTANQITGVANESVDSDRVQWGQISGVQNKAGADFYTEHFYWGQDDASDELSSPTVDGQGTLVTDAVPVIAGTSATVAWTTVSSSNTIVTWGENFNGPFESASISESVTSHSITIDDLKPDAAYTFWCESIDPATSIKHASPIRRFWTRSDASPVLAQLENGGFESGCSVYPWRDVFGGLTPAHPWPACYADEHYGYVYGTLVPYSGDAFTGGPIGGTDPLYATIREKVAVQPGTWYEVGFKFSGWHDGIQSPNDVLGRAGLDTNADDAPGFMLGHSFTSDPDVWWGDWAQLTGWDVWRDGTAYAKATGDAMSVFLQMWYDIGNMYVFNARALFDEVTFTELDPPPPAGCAAAKLEGTAGAPVDLPGVVVTYATYDGSGENITGYVEETDRTAGIRLALYDPSGEVWDIFSYGVGTNADVAGILEVNADQELQVRVKSLVPVGAGSVGSLGETNESVGGGTLGQQVGVEDGVGTNNVGLLVRVWGKVTGMEPADSAVGDGFSIFVDDGSDLTAGVTGSTTTYPGIEVVVPPYLSIDPQQFAAGEKYLTATGVASMKSWDPDGGGALDPVLKRLVLVRTDDDVQYQELCAALAVDDSLIV